MSHKGYQAELEAKKRLQLEFGELNVIKLAISQFGADYFVVGKGKLIKCVEVKECHGKRYYPLPDEKKQFIRIKTFCDEHNIFCELHIKYPNRGWSFENIIDYI